MRTSRVSASTSSIFRNEQQYLHAGDISHNFGQNAAQQFKKNMQQQKGKKQSRTPQPIKQPSPDLAIAAQVDPAVDLQLRHEMIKTATKLCRISKQQKRLQSYQSSI